MVSLVAMALVFAYVCRFLVVSDNSPRNGLSDSVDLSNSSTTADFDFDVNGGKSFLSADQEWFFEFESKSFWLDFVKRSSVDFDETFTGFAESDGGGGLFSSVDLNVFTVSWGWHDLKDYYQFCKFDLRL